MCCLGRRTRPIGAAGRVGGRALLNDQSTCFEADIDEGKREGVSTDLQKENVELRRKLGFAELKNEIVKQPRLSSGAEFDRQHNGGTPEDPRQMDV